MPKPLEKVRSDGTKVWRVRFRRNGHSSCETFFEKKRAQRFCDQIDAYGEQYAVRAFEELEIDQGETLADDSPTLDAVFAQWHEWQKPYLRSEVSWQNYATHYRVHISPTYGATPIGEITPTDVARWVDAMVDGEIGNQRTGKPLSPKTRAAAVRALVGVCLQR